jgi:Ser/Thr protein kinase RdoA (MazF antagonist)
MDLALWSPWVCQVVHQHFSQYPDEIKPGVAGTFPTFIVDDKLVVKFFGLPFNGHQSYQVERTAAEIMRHHPVFPTAELVAWGNLKPANLERWFYLVFQYLPGKRFAEAFDRLSSFTRCEFAFWIGEHLRQLHQIPLNPSMERQLPNQQNLYSANSFQVMEKHRQWGILPKYLVAQIPKFLETPGDVADDTQSGHLIHADLTGDHFLGSIVDDGWQLSGVIDFGDAMFGNLDYEMVALHLDTFRLNKKMLHAFLSGYRLPHVLQEQLPFRCMRAALLHQFNVMEAVPPTVWQTGWNSIESLANYLWGFE